MFKQTEPPLCFLVALKARGLDGVEFVVPDDHEDLKRAIRETLKRRTHVVRIFPNAESCLRLVRALAVETHENWLEAIRYLNMGHLAEHKKETLRKIDQAA